MPGQGGPSVFRAGIIGKLKMKDENRTDKQQLEAWLENIPALFHGKFRKEWLKAACKISLRAAVNAKCRDCSCWQNPEIRECTVITCPLWQHRPFARSRPEQKKRADLTLDIAQHLFDEFCAQTSASEQSGAQNQSLWGSSDETKTQENRAAKAGS